MFYFDQYAIVKDVLDLKAAENPTRKSALGVPVNATLSQLMNYMCDHKVGAVFLHNEMKEIIGIITERDLVHHLAFYEKKAFDMPFDQIIVRDILFCTPDEKLKEVSARMAQNHIRHMAVKDETGKFIGIISSSDIELFAGEG